MEIIRREKAEEIRSLATSFLKMADGANLPGYKAKLLHTAALLSDAADALESELLSEAQFA